MRERAEKPIVISLHKSGTNLVTRLFQAMGYSPVGAGVNQSYEAIFRALRARGGEPRYQAFLDDERAVLAAPSALLGLCSEAFAGGTSIFLHGLDKGAELPQGDDTPLVFNYRDPRAVLVSFVHYLTDGAREDFTKISGYVELSEMLKRLSSVEERLGFVMDYVPNYLKGAFLGNAWLLDAPQAVCVSYEDLVGPRGGGSEAAQLASVARLMQHLGVDGEPEEVAARLYDTGSRTFRKGRVSGWRDEFGPELERRFVAKYGDILERYGYEA